MEPSGSLSPCHPFRLFSQPWGSVLLPQPLEKSILFPAVAGTGGIHLLFDAFLLHECLLQELKMSAHHTVRDMQGRDGSVAELLVRPAVESLPRSVVRDVNSDLATANPDDHHPPACMGCRHLRLPYQ